MTKLQTAKLSAAEPQAADFAHAWQAYFFALRPNFLSLTLVLCLSILGLASRAAVVDWWAFSLGTLAALCLHAAANVFNDVADDDNGSDRFNQGHIFPFTGGSRFIQNGIVSRDHMLRLACLALLLAVILGAWLWWRVGVVVLWFGVFGAFCAWAYSLPPLRLNARGLGELCVALSFGLLPVGLAWVSLGSLQRPTLWFAGIGGLLTMALLHINQFPDCAADVLAGKRHWVARLPVNMAVFMHMLLILLAFSLLALGCFLGELPPSFWLGLLLLPLSLFALRELAQHAKQPCQLRRGIIASLVVAHLMPLLFALLWLF